VTTALDAQGRSNDAAEFFALPFSPLAAPRHVIGHPSRRNEPSFIAIRRGQNARVIVRSETIAL
jgi:hypothetical protein